MEREITQLEIDNGNFKAEQTMKWVLGLSLGIMFIVALMLQFDKISLMVTITILGILTSICLIIKLSLSKAPSENEESIDTNKKTAGSGHNQGDVLIAYYIGLLIFIIITLLASLWVLYSILGMYFNFWIGLIFAITNLTLWGIWSKYSFDQKYEGAVLLQLKFNGEYKQWGKNMRPAWWGVCKVTPFVGWLEGKLEKFSEETFLITHEVFKTEKGSEDGAVVSVKVDDDSGNSFPVVVKFEAPARICDTYIIATTEEKEKGAKKQLVPKIFGGLMTLLNQAKSLNGVKPTKVEDFEPIRPNLSTEAEKIMLPCFNNCGFELVKGFNLTAVEPTTVEELSRSNARAQVAAAMGEVAAEKIKVDGGITNVENTMTRAKVSGEIAIPFVLATQGDTRRQDTNVTVPGSSGGGKKGGKNKSDLGQAALFAALDNHGGE